MLIMKTGNTARLLQFIFIAILVPLNSGAQSGLTAEQSRDKLVAGKIGKPFALHESMNTIDGKRYAFLNTERPAFVYIGEEYCIVCKFEFPVFLEMVQQFPGIDFIYLSTDGDSVLKRKIGKEIILPNLYAIRVANNFLWDRDVAKVYPVKYFLNSKGIVMDAATGGQTKDRGLVREIWQPVLEALK
jgi:thiol-disulfide isomerase/thioredoxin